MKTMAGIKVVNELMGQNVDLSDRCCGESGTLSVTRPDVSTQIRFRKQQEIEQGVAKLRGDGGKSTDGNTPLFKGDIKILTSCPSCLQGLSRYNDDGGTQADYIVVEMARHLLGADWMEKYIQKACSGGIERVLL